MNDTSNLKFIVDVGVGRIIEEWIEHQGFNVISIAKLNPEMADSNILKIADNENAILITMDKDFGELVFKSNSSHKGILLLRLEDAVAEEKLAAIQNIFSSHEFQMKNNFCVYQNGKLRIRDK